MKKLKAAVSFPVISIVVIALIAISLLVSPMPITANNGNPHLVKTFPGPNGKLIDEVVFPTKPPLDKVKTSVLLPPIVIGTVNYIADNVPALKWSYGCSATSASMLFGYYDRNNYSNFYTGTIDNGLFPLPTDTQIYWSYTAYHGTTCYECPLSASHKGVEGRATNGHVDDYWIDYGSNSRDPYITGRWTQHASDSVGDFMGTNQYRWHNSDGSTTFYFNTDGSPLYDYSGSEILGYRDGGHGMKLFAESKGYTVTTVFNQYIKGKGSDPTLGFTFADYMKEIDAGRPVLIQVEGHTMIGFGYNTTGNLVYLHDTWGFYDSEMKWGGIYSSGSYNLQHYGVTVFQLDPASSVPTTPTITAVSPSQGKRGKTLNITVTGTNLTGASVSFSSGISGTSGIKINGYSKTSPTQIIVNISIDRMATLGYRDVVVTTSGETDTLPNGFNVLR